MKVECYAAMAAKQPLEKFEYEARELGDLDVQVAVTHCGICYSDVHFIDNDGGLNTFPFVPGHEIVGNVSALGSKVTTLKNGDRVGIGFQARSCGECEWCIRGEENLCPQILKSTTWRPYGGFATSIIVDSRFTFPLPKNLESENVAPLLCGGITVYSALRNHDIRPSMKVGVVGIGGLGHLALQFANAFGCDVTAFSSTPGKEEEANALGAAHFIASNDPAQLLKATRSLDFVISAAHDLDWNAYLNTLRPNGKLCIIGFPKNPISIPALPLLFGQRSVCGSVVGGRSAIREMLEFAARRGIKAKTEVMQMSQVNEAIAKLRANKVRYRIVLKN